jgi:hypothetical protein
MKPSLNWLLIFIPITLAVEHIEVPLPVLFFCAALALIPIAGLIVKATEQIAMRTNDAVGGLLNATFGNAPELIIGMVALRDRLARNGAGFSDRCDSGKPASGSGPVFLSRRDSPPCPTIQSDSCAHLQHHDAAGFHEYGDT